MNPQLNEHNQQIGEPVLNWQERPYPGDMHCTGDYAIVTRLSIEHTQDLFEAYRASQPANWTYLSTEPPTDFATFEQSIVEKINHQTAVFYAVLDRETNCALGMFSLMRIDPKNGVVEVGNVIFSDALRRTRIATEAHELLTSYVFEELGYRRYEWKCDALNKPSFRAAERLGFTYEGTFRHAVVYKGRSRDTAWFSMLAEEWPDRKRVFIKWLARDNFDDQGMQLKSLAEYREEEK